ncbi:MAG: hypothetical protein K1000chlam2_00818 [Chlamydiae bacterium]|nr:hypothetical protein [Chlamydiota bacterium]
MSNTTLSLSTLPLEVLMPILEQHVDLRSLSYLGQTGKDFDALVNDVFTSFMSKTQRVTNTNQESPIQQIKTFVNELYSKARILGDDRIQHLLTQPKTLENLKLLQKYLVARDKIILWKVVRLVVLNCPTPDQLMTCEDVIAKAEGFSAAFNQHKQQLIETTTGLKLSGKNLTHIPSEVFELSNLKEICLGYNLLTEIPDEIGNLTHLETLELEENLLKSLPSQIVDLNALQWLFLENNKLESIPSGMNGLPNLVLFKLHDNQLSFLPDGFDQISCTELTIGKNRLDSLPPFPNVETLVTLEEDLGGEKRYFEKEE